MGMVVVPKVGESVYEGVLVEWTLADGATVREGDELFVLETDKVTLSINAESSGRLKTLVAPGTTVKVGQVVGEIEAAASASPSGEAAKPVPAPKPEPQVQTRPEPAAQARPEPPPITPPAGPAQVVARLLKEPPPPAVQRLLAEHELDPESITGSGKDGRLTKADVLRHLAERSSPNVPVPVTGLQVPVEAALVPPAAPSGSPAPLVEAALVPPAAPGGSPAPMVEAALVPPAAPGGSPAPMVEAGKRQTRERMSQLRLRLAERLVQVQQTAAILTTFNEVDMSAVLELRRRSKPSFEERHGVELGLMSFFVKATVDALRTVPEVNAFVEGDEVIRNHYYDIAVAVSTDKGLVTPVIRDADGLSLAELEIKIAELARRARERKLELAELQGAVFTISNGGVFGSLLSTPILNPPQSAILGMHAIKKRPVVVDDQIVIRPMMYLAVSYDHRLIDGREAVTFLKRIVEVVEAPERMLLEL